MTPRTRAARPQQETPADRQALDRTLADMRRANAHVNAATTAVDYQVACVGLALVTRQYLRLLDEIEAR